MPFRYIPQMDFRLLRYFIATVEEGSLQGASRRMNIAQPALSRRIRDLALNLDCALLVRGPRGVVVTPAGQAFYEDAVALVKGLDTVLLGSTWSNMFSILLTNSFSIIGTIMGVKYASEEKE